MKSNHVKTSSMPDSSHARYSAFTEQIKTSVLLFWVSPEILLRIRAELSTFFFLLWLYQMQSLSSLEHRQLLWTPFYLVLLQQFYQHFISGAGLSINVYNEKFGVKIRPLSFFLHLSTALELLLALWSFHPTNSLAIWCTGPGVFKEGTFSPFVVYLKFLVMFSCTTAPWWKCFPTSSPQTCV